MTPLRRALWIALGCLLAWAALGSWKHRPVTPPPGVLAPDPPQQVNLDDGAVLQRGDVSLRTRAHIELTARLLASERYRFDEGASLAPFDFGLGWGRLSDSSVLASIKLDQSGRFLHWRTAHFPVPRQELERSAANMHLIPADHAIASTMARMRPGQLVHLEGFLVDARRADGWQWHTSMRRDDTGAGACELVFVERLEVATP